MYLIRPQNNKYLVFNINKARRLNDDKKGEAQQANGQREETSDAVM